MNIILVPGLFGKAEFLSSLRERLEEEGYPCWGPGFHANTMVRNELELLRRRCERLGPVILVGHSAGGLLSVLLAREQTVDIRGVIGLESPVFTLRCPVPYYEARSCWGWLAPSPAEEVKRFWSLHVTLPMKRSVQDWVVEKVRQVIAKTPPDEELLPWPEYDKMPIRWNNRPVCWIDR